MDGQRAHVLTWQPIRKPDPPNTPNQARNTRGTQFRIAHTSPDPDGFVCDLTPTRWELDLAQLRPDPCNANKGTERGTGMVEHSLRHFGAGRSILVDRHGVVIAGNKTLEAAASLGMDRLVVVPTDGHQLVAVQRTDLDLATDPAAVELAIADNRCAQVGLAWDTDALAQLQDQGANLDQFWSADELARLLDPGQDAATAPQDNEQDQAQASGPCRKCAPLVARLERDLATARRQAQPRVRKRKE